MKTAGKIVIGAIAGIGVILGGAALAHSHGMGHGHGMMGTGGKLCDPAARVDEHLASFKDQLKLKSQQTDAWQAFETAVRAQAQGMAQARASKGRTAETGTDAMEAKVAFMEQRLAGMKTVLKARNDLYAALTPEQKTVADKQMQHGSHFGPHR